MQQDVKKLVDDIAELRPTTFVGVPRVFHRIYDKVMQGINESPWPRRKLFHYAFQAKTDALRKGALFTTALCSFICLTC
jgi:long-chain acyl-CoA synthetase